MSKCVFQQSRKPNGGCKGYARDMKGERKVGGMELICVWEGRSAGEKLYAPEGLD